MKKISFAEGINAKDNLVIADEDAEENSEDVKHQTIDDGKQRSENVEKEAIDNLKQEEDSVFNSSEPSSPLTMIGTKLREISLNFDESSAQKRKSSSASAQSEPASTSKI